MIDTRSPYDLGATFSLLAMGSGDPCLRLDAPDHLRMAFATPGGPVAVTVLHQGTRLHVTSIGPGGDWLSGKLSAWLGVDYRPPVIDLPRKLKDIAKQYEGMRVPLLPAISLRLVQIILQQMISFRDACAGWRRLVKRFGTPVPAHDDLWFPPSPETLKDLATYQFIECAVLPKHGRTIAASMRHASGLERIWGAGLAPDAAERTCHMLSGLPGIGPWTIGFLRGAGMGDADAVVLGDYSHPAHVSSFFTGKAAADDEEMLRLLEPYKPDRFYVLALLVNGAPRPPRRGPRRASLRDRLR